MRAHWKLVSGLGLVGAIALLPMVGSAEVAGDPALPEQPAMPQEAVHADPDPSVQYELGPGKILYDEQDPEEQANLDRMAEVTAEAQDARSHDSFARAAKEEADRARAEIAARHVGLTGTEDQGVIP